MPVEIRDHAEARGSDHHRHDGKTVEAVGEVHRVARADHDEGAEDHEEPAEVDHEILEEGITSEVEDTSRPSRTSA